MAEIAHIFAAEDTGPRAEAALSEEERGRFENLILLCPNCHTRIDKAPDSFPDATILDWKRRHEQSLDNAFGVVKFDTRQAARNYIRPLLEENGMVFQRFGPHNDDHLNPESEMASMWHHKACTTLIPNGTLVRRALEANRHLLTKSERHTLIEYAQHLDDFTERHSGNSTPLGGSTFPSEMATILS